MNLSELAYDNGRMAAWRLLVWGGEINWLWKSAYQAAFAGIDMNRAWQPDYMRYLGIKE